MFVSQACSCRLESGSTVVLLTSNHHSTLEIAQPVQRAADPAAFDHGFGRAHFGQDAFIETEVIAAYSRECPPKLCQPA
jgi:hypothetical protein